MKMNDVLLKRVYMDARRKAEEFFIAIPGCIQMPAMNNDPVQGLKDIQIWCKQLPASFNLKTQPHLN